jgi:two-component system nitrate/nitrite response regulator NarL
MVLSILALYSYQPLVVECLEKKLAKSKYLSLVASTMISSDAIGIAAQHKPAFFVVDCGAPDRGINLLREVHKASPATKVIFFTGIENSEHAVLALDAGAAGYISSACTKIDVLTALELIAAGQTFVSPHVAARVIKHFRASSGDRKKSEEQRMTHREEQIAQLLLQGQTNRAMADHLGLSEKTVKYYMSNLMQKFEVSSRLELAMALPRAAQTVHNFQ